MSPEKEKYLVNKYPKLYKNLGQDFACGDGWFNIIDELSSKLSTDINNIPTAEQVKEKFGTLRFYVDNATDIQYKFIDEAERKSRITCEVCSAPGKLDTNRSWLKTLCDIHKNNAD